MSERVPAMVLQGECGSVRWFHYRDTCEDYIEMIIGAQPPHSS